MHRLFSSFIVRVQVYLVTIFLHTVESSHAGQTDRPKRRRRETHFANCHYQCARTFRSCSFVTREYKHNNIDCVIVCRDKVIFSWSVHSPTHLYNKICFFCIGSLPANGTCEEWIWKEDTLPIGEEMQYGLLQTDLSYLTENCEVPNWIKQVHICVA
jgi:hypothetical protein